MKFARPCWNPPVPASDTITAMRNGIWPGCMRTISIALPPALASSSAGPRSVIGAPLLSSTVT